MSMLILKAKVVQKQQKRVNIFIAVNEVSKSFTKKKIKIKQKPNGVIEAKTCRQ